RSTFFWMLMLRGLGMSMLFMPITTLSLTGLKGKQIGQGASFTGMMRQLGGSFGVAIMTVLLDRKTASHRVDLVSHVTADQPNVAARVTGLQHLFMSQGTPPNQALAKAYAILNGAVSKQAAVLSYMDA